MFDTALIDDFNRSEAPLSDSSRWVQQYISGGTDYSVCGTFPYTPGHVAHAVGTGGLGLAIRHDTPDAQGDSEVYFFSSGIMLDINTNSAVLRADFAGNFYEARFSGNLVHGSFGISVRLYKWAGLAPSLLATATDTSFDATNTYMGFRAIGSTLTAYAQKSGVWTQLATTTDASYASGLLGFGAGFGSQQLSQLHGGAVIERGLYTPPILVPYNRPITRA